MKTAVAQTEEFVYTQAAPLFLSARTAVRFAVTREGNAPCPLASWMADATTGSRDLAGLDGAAQAGMIMNILGALGPLAVATLVADVAPRTMSCACRRPCCSGEMANAQWRNAVDRISQEAEEVTTVRLSYALRSAIVVKLYSGKKGPDLKQIADEFHLDRHTVGRYHGEIHRWLRGAKAHKNAAAVEGIEPNAWSDAETSLRSHGIVADEIV